MLRITYRISDAGNPKVKLSFADKRFCLENSIKIFGIEYFTVFADNCLPGTIEMIRGLELEPIQTKLGNAMSWRNAAQYAVQSFDDEDIVCFLEDDYLHLPSALKVLLEGIDIADYITLYDHPDKYGIGGANPYVENGAEVTKLLLTKSSHWKVTNSTTMTFATKVKTLKEDWDIWMKYTSDGFSDDFGAFQALSGIGSWSNRVFGKHRTLISCIPGLSTHAETAWLSPLENWANI